MNKTVEQSHQTARQAVPTTAVVSGDEATRIAFETWVSDDHQNPLAIERRDEHYKLIQVQNDWIAWKACAEAIGIKWHRYPDNTPFAVGSYLVVKSADGIREIEWAYFSSNSKWLSTTGFLIDGVVTHFSRMPLPPAR